MKKKKSKIIEDLRKINFSINNIPYVLIYNEKTFTKEEAITAINTKDYDNPAISIMTEVQWKNVFNNGEL